MNDYMQGVLTFPMVVILTAAAVAATFGAFLILEKWWDGRAFNNRRHRKDDVLEYTGAYVSSARRILSIRGFQWRILIVHDPVDDDTEESRIMAIRHAIVTANCDYNREQRESGQR
jgi:hypothetical protein